MKTIIQKRKLVMLPAKGRFLAMQYSKLIIDDNSGRLHYIENPREASWGHQHLYVIADKIVQRNTLKEGDFIHTTNIPIEKVKRIYKDYSTQKGYEWLIEVEGSGNQYKPCEIIGHIEATTDKSLELLDERNEKLNITYMKCLPGLPKYFVQDYASAQGKIYEIGVEMEENIQTEEDYDMIKKLNLNNKADMDIYESLLKVKVGSDRNILIHPNKTYTEQEHRRNLVACVSEIAAELGHASTSVQMKVWNDATNKWIENNL